MGQTAGHEIDDPGARRAVEFLLQAARRRLAMDAAYLSELTPTEQIFVATTGPSAAAFGVEPGGRVPLADTYCQHVLATDAPFVIRDTDAEPRVADIPNRGIAAYVGVPVRAPHGEVFGTLCCVHHEARQELADHDLAVMETLADILGQHLEQLARHRASLGWLAAQVAELTEVMEDRDLQIEVFQHMVDRSLNVMLLLDASTLSIAYANLTAAELVGRDRSDLLEQVPWQLHACWDETTLRAQVVELQHDGAPPITTTIPAVAGLRPWTSRCSGSPGRAAGPTSCGRATTSTVIKRRPRGCGRRSPVNRRQRSSWANSIGPDARSSTRCPTNSGPR